MYVTPEMYDRASIFKRDQACDFIRTQGILLEIRAGKRKWNGDRKLRI